MGADQRCTRWFAEEHIEKNPSRFIRCVQPCSCCHQLMMHAHDSSLAVRSGQLGLTMKDYLAPTPEHHFTKYVFVSRPGNTLWLELTALACDCCPQGAVHQGGPDNGRPLRFCALGAPCRVACWVRVLIQSYYKWITWWRRVRARYSSARRRCVVILPIGCRTRSAAALPSPHRRTCPRRNTC